MKVEQEFSLPKPPLKTALLRAPNGLRIELIERKGAKRDRQFKDPMDATLSLGFGHCAIQVANLDDAFAKLKDDGATIVSPPSPGASPGWKFAYVKDPEGNLIEVLQIDPAKH
jgi:catechol 2,3-dioxygenase-like lactoylglutathione lyase family enzyme